MKCLKRLIAIYHKFIYISKKDVYVYYKIIEWVFPIQTLELFREMKLIIIFNNYYL